jgi:transcriptional regulator with XRE-family HTH domain
MEDNFDVHLGSWLKQKRNDKGMTLQEVADRMGVTRTAVHCWETGKRSMYASTLMDYCNVLGADLDEYIKKSTDRR